MTRWYFSISLSVSFFIHVYVNVWHKIYQSATENSDAQHLTKAAVLQHCQNLYHLRQLSKNNIESEA